MRGAEMRSSLFRSLIAFLIDCFVQFNARSSSLWAAMQAYVRLDLPPHVILVL
jgi:hypothetical protein